VGHQWLATSGPLVDFLDKIQAAQPWLPTGGPLILAPVGHMWHAIWAYISLQKIVNNPQPRI